MLLTKRLKRVLKTYTDFPQQGVNFVDITPLLIENSVLSELISEMANLQIIQDSDAVIAIDARGFIFGSCIALKAKKPLILARKPNKLPGNILKAEYNLEYGKNELSIKSDSLEPFNDFVILDDVLATGGSIESVCKIVQSKNKNIMGVAVVIEIVELNGRTRFDFPVFSQVKY